METAAETGVGILVELVLATIACGVLYRLFGRILNLPQRQVVLSFQNGVILRGDKVEKVVTAGTYWVKPKRTLLLCDMRPRPFQVPAQELLTADSMAVRISLGGEYRVAKPASFLLESSDPFGALYLDLRQALRAAIAEQNSDVLLAGNSLLLSRIKELLIPRSQQLGIELVQLDILEAIPLGWSNQD